MRVLIATGPVGSIPGPRVAELIGTAFAHEGAQVAVVDLDETLPAPGSLEELAQAIACGATAIDVTRMPFHFDDTSALREVIRGAQFVGIVGDDEPSAPLTGISGTTLARSRAAGEGLAAGLAAEAAATQWLREQGLDDAPGSGACGGLGAVLLGAGIELSARLPFAVGRTGFEQTAAIADLIVTGCTDLDFHARGGPLVQAVVDVAQRALRPVIVVAASNFVSARELRLAGIEDAYPIHRGMGSQPVTEGELQALASRLARTWRFPAR